MSPEKMPPINLDLLIRRIYDVVKAVRPREARESLEVYFETAIYPALLESFTDQGSEDNGNVDVVLAMIGLIVYLGPDDAKFPPAILCEELIRLAQDLTALEPDHHPPDERSKWLVQLALAYGCLWGRLAKSGKPRWDEVWPGALKVLTEIAFNNVVSAIRTLKDSVRGFQEPDEDDQKGYAALIAWTFITKRPSPDEPKYEKFRALREWRPEKGNLYAWLQRAIQGVSRQQKRFQAHWFHYGLLFPWLNLKADPGVAFKKCLHHSTEEEAPCSEVSEYSQEPCSQEHSYTPEYIYISSKALLVVPGVYRGRNFWHCAEDGGYYDYHLSACPRDGHPRHKNQRPATLWVRKEWSPEVDEE